MRCYTVQLLESNLDPTRAGAVSIRYIIVWLAAHAQVQISAELVKGICC